jgi:hypothetical protein
VVSRGLPWWGIHFLIRNPLMGYGVPWSSLESRGGWIEHLFGAFAVTELLLLTLKTLAAISFKALARAPEEKQYPPLSQDTVRSSAKRTSASSTRTRKCARVNTAPVLTERQQRLSRTGAKSKAKETVHVETNSTIIGGWIFIGHAIFRAGHRAPPWSATVKLIIVYGVRERAGCVGLLAAQRAAFDFPAELVDAQRCLRTD